MIRLRFLLLGIALMLPLSAPAQQAKTPAKPMTRVPPGSVPGYTIKLVEGFTVLLSEETVKEDEKSKLERKPLETLEWELKYVGKMLAPEAVKALQKVLIWVEWDTQRASASGRSGTVLAIYYGGHQAQAMAKGEHPLKAKAVTVMSLKRLAMEHQPGKDSGGCTLLHELSHAVHYELLGKENPTIKAAYKQAMERKLYDPATYASTNESEFFAELTCAYFDQLEYYPRNRDELKKHDPVTFSLMERTWGKARRSSTEAKTTASKPPNPGDPSLKLEKLDLGKAISGPAFAAADAKGRGVFVVLWNALTENSCTAMVKLANWDNELRPYGLTIVGVHMTGRLRSDIAAEARSRNVAFAVRETYWTDKSIVEDDKQFPLCLFFDPEGRCTYRGSFFDAEETVRGTIGKMLVISAGKEFTSKPVVTQVEALQKGKAPLSVLPQLVSLSRLTDADAAAEAKLLIEKIIEPGQIVLQDAEKLLKDDPVGAYVALEKLPTIYKGTPLAAKASEHISKLRSDKGVQLEMKARPALAVVQKMDTELNGRPGSFDAKGERFRTENAAALKQMKDAILQMKKTWPTTKATQEAVRLGQKYALAVN
jgi:hypothetical protein